MDIAWGIAMAGFSLFGMLAVWIAVETMEDGTSEIASMQRPQAPAGIADRPVELKKAA
jgi:hypothetical protein